MIKILCDRCRREIDSEKAFKVCEVHHKGNIEDTTILCSPCMRVVAFEIIRLEEERAKHVAEILQKWKTEKGGEEK